MQPRIKEVLDHLDANRAELRNSVAGVPVENQQRKLSPESWSVTEVLEHLAIIDASVTGLLRKKIAEGRAAGLGEEADVSSVVNPRHIEKMRDRSFRIETGDATRPKSSLAPQEAWAAVERAREGLREVILDADGLALGEISAPHRIFGSLNGYEWIAFIGNHESRHAAQIREIGAGLDGRGA